jgi:hypothetical protein
LGARIGRFTVLETEQLNGYDAISTPIGNALPFASCPITLLCNVAANFLSSTAPVSVNTKFLMSVARITLNSYTALKVRVSFFSRSYRSEDLQRTHSIPKTYPRTFAKREQATPALSHLARFR